MKQWYTIQGGNPLEGTVTISGAKNAAVAIIPASILAGGNLHAGEPSLY